MSSEKQDPSFILGKTPGPYVEEVSRSLYCRLGANIAFVGLDARTERTRHQVNYEETYEVVFNRLKSELGAKHGKIKHLIVLLGVPIAYPRLVWLENIFSSPLMGPIRLLNKRFGVGGGFFNNFDGGVDLLDDLDDHYTARTHKPERKELILRLQKLALEHSVRVTILGGDVHLAATGRFYSKPKLNIAPENDHRYMANVISSAITNKPPPSAVANLLSRRNRIHHLDHETDETLMPLFDRDPNPRVSKTNTSNSVTMPSRNYAIISENPIPHPPASISANGVSTSSNIANDGITHHELENQRPSSKASSFAGGGARPKTKPKDGHAPVTVGEEGAGSTHAVATGMDQGALAGGLDVSIRVEIDQHDREGLTVGYGFSSKSPAPLLCLRRWIC